MLFIQILFLYKLPWFYINEQFLQKFHTFMKDYYLTLLFGQKEGLHDSLSGK